MCPASEVTRSQAGVTKPSNFQRASGEALAKASYCMAFSQAAVSAGAISGQARVEGMNSLKRPGRNDGV